MAPAASSQTAMARPDQRATRRDDRSLARRVLGTSFGGATRWLSAAVTRVHAKWAKHDLSQAVGNRGTEEVLDNPLEIGETPRSRPQRLLGSTTPDGGIALRVRRVEGHRRTRCGQPRPVATQSPARA